MTAATSDTPHKMPTERPECESLFSMTLTLKRTEHSLVHNSKPKIVQCSYRCILIYIPITSVRAGCERKPMTIGRGQPVHSAAPLNCFIPEFVFYNVFCATLLSLTCVLCSETMFVWPGCPLWKVVTTCGGSSSSSVALPCLQAVRLRSHDQSLSISSAVNALLIKMSVPHKPK